MFSKGLLLSVFIGFVSLLLTACGGGGGGAPAPIAPTPIAPTPIAPVASLPFVPIESSQTFNPQLLQVLQVPASTANVQLSANALVKSDLSQPVGNVNMGIGVVNPAIQFDILPGGLLTKLSDGRVLPIEIYGAVSLAFVDAEGSQLNLAAGSSAIIRIPLVDKSNNPDNTVPLYYYDVEQDVWLEEGTAELLGDAATNSQYYEGRINRFSIWAAGNIYSQVNIAGCVENIGDPLAAAAAISVADVNIISSGVNYSGELQSKSNGTGLYSVAAKQNAEVLIYGELNGVKTNTIKVITDTNDQVLSDCLKFTAGLGDKANESISIKASWGVPNVDIDARLTGPLNLNIFFNFFGFLETFPFLHFDVTDDDGYGPEVMTIFKFDSQGTYQYFISREGFTTVVDPITNALATVELNINGDITVFTPPPAEGDNLIWNVFNFVVEADGSFTVDKVNVWLPAFVDGN